MHASRGLSHLANVLPEAEEENGLPKQNADEYRPHSRPANKPVFALHLISSAWKVRTFQYSDLDSDSRYTPESIHLRFAGTEVINVTISGRSLWKLYENLHRQVISWIMETGRDLASDGDCIVTELKFEHVL